MQSVGDCWLYPCVQFVKGGPASRRGIGHVGTGVDEAARERIHAESEHEKPACRECALRLRCNNSCGCLNWQITGSVSAISPTLCRHEQTLMPIADRLGRELYRQRDPHFLHYNAAYPVLSMIHPRSAKYKRARKEANSYQLGNMVYSEIRMSEKGTTDARDEK